MTRRPTVLFTSSVLKHPPAGGPYLRIENSIKALHQISDLHIYGRVSLKALGGQEAFEFYKSHCQRIQLSPELSFAKRALNSLSRRLFGTTPFSVDHDSPAIFREVLRMADAVNADVIWLGYGNISYPFLKYIKSHTAYKVVLDTDSVWSRFVLRGLPYAKDVAERERIEKSGREKEGEERWGTRLADVTTAVSEVDAEYYRGLAASPRQVQLFSNVIDVNSYEHAPAAADNLKKPCIYLAGTFGPRSPMDDAARWVINGVLPLVRKQIPDVHFYIVGTGSQETLADITDPEITILGKLPSVLPYLCHADVALVPLRFESGTRFKILEAGACGIPVVSTTLGAEGLPVVNEQHLLIGDEPQTFTDGIVRLIRDRAYALKLAGNLRKLVREQNSIASLAQEAHHILQYLQVT